MFGVYFRHKKGEELKLTLQYKFWSEKWKELADDDSDITFKIYVDENKSNFELKNLLNDISLYKINNIWIPDILNIKHDMLEKLLLICKGKKINLYINNKIADIEQVYDDCIDRMLSDY